MPQEGFRVPQVTKLVGISYRQLDYWARTGLVTPSIQDAVGSGTQRLYSFQDLVLLKSIKELLDTGLSLQKIRRSIATAKDLLDLPPHGLTLMSDGKRILAAESPEQIIDLLKGGQGVFAIDLSQVWSSLEASVEKARGRAARAGGA